MERSENTPKLKFLPDSDEEKGTKPPITKRRMRKISNENQMDRLTDRTEHLSQDGLYYLMCGLPLEDMLTFATLNKRANAMFRDPYFIEHCIRPKIFEKTQKGDESSVDRRIALGKYKIDKSSSNYRVSVYGTTPEGIKYRSSWSLDPDVYARHRVEELYGISGDESESESEEEGKDEGHKEMKRDIKSIYKNYWRTVDHFSGSMSIRLPDNIIDPVFVLKKVESMMPFIYDIFKKAILDNLDEAETIVDETNEIHTIDSWGFDLMILQLDVEVSVDFEEAHQPETLFRVLGDKLSEELGIPEDGPSRRFESYGYTYSKERQYVSSEKKSIESSMLTKNLVDAIRQLRITIEQTEESLEETRSERKDSDARSLRMCDETVAKSKETVRLFDTGFYASGLTKGEIEEYVKTLRSLNSRLLDCIYIIKVKK